MREKQQQTNQVESFSREIGNRCRSFFIRVDLSALKINEYFILLNNNAGMKKRTLKTKYPVFLSLIFQTMR